MKRSKSKASEADAKIDDLNEGMPVPPEGTTAIPHIPVAAKGMVQGAAPGSVAPTDAPLDSDDPESMLAYQSLMRHRKQRRRKRIILIAVVIGALLLTGIYKLFNTTIMPTVTSKVTELFNYSGT